MGAQSYLERLQGRLHTMERRLSELTGNGAEWAAELWKIANGGYGAQPNHRIQALEIIGNRIFGKVAEQHAHLLVGAGDGERPYATLPAEALERLIRGLPAPITAAPDADPDVVDGEIVQASGNEPDDQAPKS